MIDGLHVITDRDAALPVLEQVLAAARGGARVVQLRDKHATDAVFARTARAAKAALAPFGVLLVVNDRVAVARQVGADGVHIGQSDGDPRAVRDAIGPAMILGLSIEALAQLAAVTPGLVDYVGAGPVRATATKPDHAAPLGLDGLARIAAAAPCPTIAIGGLRHGDAGALKAAGAAGIAVVSAISRAPDPQAATRALLAEWRDA